MGNQETVIDILAEMRLGSTGGLPFAYQIGRPNRIGEHIRIDSVTVADLADRIEAAWKREQIGRDTLSDGRSLTVAVAKQRLRFIRLEVEYAGLLSMAAARKALETIRDTLRDRPYDFDEDALFGIACDALSAPARNCDKYRTATEAKEAFFKAYFGPTEDGFWEGAYADWLLDEAEKKEGAE